jgi:hypothetical protein
MVRAKTVAQRLREDPAFKAMYDDVKQLMKLWPGTHAVAHRDEETGKVTFWLHMGAGDLARLDVLLDEATVESVHDGAVTTYRVHGRRADMDVLLGKLSR